MDQIGRYQITGELGRGAMGIVYRAHDPSIGRTVAIKTIRLADAASEKERRFLRDRLFREARSAGILSHPNIVTIYDILEENGICYVFMEYVDGPPLEKLITTDDVMDKRVMLTVLEQTAAALDYAHEKGIVHRDIKPGNIMIASNGMVKITDFGIAKFTSQQATSTGILLGTPSYMAPEQISDQRVDGRSDQFALAVITYQLLTGERPFTGSSLPSLMFKIVNEEPVPAGRINSTLSAATDVVLKKGLGKAPDQRYANCVSFVRAFTNACELRPDWRPMRQGMMESMETVSEPMPVAMRVTAPAAAPAPLPPPTPVVVAPPPEPKPQAMPSRPTRLAPPPIPVRKRSTTVAAFLAGFVFVGLIAYAVTRLLPTSTPLPVEPPVVNEAAKPSPMGPPPPDQEQPKVEAKTADPDLPKPEPAKPEAPAPEPEPQVPVPAKREPVRHTTVPARVPLEDAQIRVVTSPPGAKVMFDGQPRLMCVAPCVMTLPAGRHTFATILDGYRSQNRIFNLPEEREQIVAMERSFGTLIVRSTPQGAAIIIDGVERRERTPAQFTLTAGRHKLGILKEGYKREEQEIEVKDGVVANIDFAWPK